MRLKLAAILGLGKRWPVSEEDWALAGLLTAYHVAVRSYAIGTLRSHAAHKDEMATNKEAFRHVVKNSAVDRDDAELHDMLVSKLVTKVNEQPGITVRDLQQWAHAGPRFSRTRSTQRSKVAPSRSDPDAGCFLRTYHSLWGSTCWPVFAVALLRVACCD